MLLSSQHPLRAVTLLTFEGFADSTILTNQYSGETFGNAIILTAGITLNEFEFPPHSGVNVASDNGGPMTISFTSPVQSFSGYFTYSEPLTVRAFNAASAQVAAATSQFSDNEALSGIAGSSPNELIQVTSAGGIASVTIAGDPAGESFTLDDATITGLAGPPATPLPPTLPLASIGLVLAGIWVFVARQKQSVTMQQTALALLFLLPLSFVGLRLYADPQTSSIRQREFSAARAIGRPSVTPGIIRAGAPTRVLVTAHIDHPALIPASVNLIRLNPNGSPTIIGHLRDDETDGDTTARDRVYRGQIDFNESTPRQIQLQVSVAIRGRMRRVVSELLIVVVGASH
jgi:hypothetical protein